jgi:DNA-binding NarL/FixJ family response regulator
VIRVLVADDHPMFRDGLRMMIEATDDIEVAAEVADGTDVVGAIRGVEVDLALLDVNMPGLNGIDAAARLSASRPEVAVLMLTMFDDDASVFAALRAGARGYVLKGAEQDEIERALRTVAAGGAVMSPQVASRLLGSLSPRAMDLPALTPREREVLELLASGAPNGRIADALGLAPKTVANHLSALLLKLGVATRGEAIVAARNAGLGGARPW